MHDIARLRCSAFRTLELQGGQFGRYRPIEEAGDKHYDLTATRYPDYVHALQCPRCGAKHPTCHRIRHACAYRQQSRPPRTLPRYWPTPQNTTGKRGRQRTLTRQHEAIVNGSHRRARPVSIRRPISLRNRSTTGVRGTSLAESCSDVPG